MLLFMLLLSGIIKMIFRQNNLSYYIFKVQANYCFKNTYISKKTFFSQSCGWQWPSSTLSPVPETWEIGTFAQYFSSAFFSREISDVVFGICWSHITGITFYLYSETVQHIVATNKIKIFYNTIAYYNIYIYT